MTLNTKQTARIINDVLYTGVPTTEAMRRLNAHDELVAALRQAADDLEILARACPDRVHNGERMAENARAALPKVQS